VTKDLPILKDADAIRRSVRNIVQTIPKEKFLIRYLDPILQKVYLNLLILVLPR
jgi:hypothetical protein